jgi:hypothetical protein
MSRKHASKAQGSGGWRYLVLLLFIGSASGLIGFGLNREAPGVPVQDPSRMPVVVDTAEGARAEIDLRTRVSAADVAPEIPQVERVVDDAVTPDPVWERLPVTRGGVTFPERFLEGPLSTFPTQRLFRSQDLNPLGAYVSPEQRSALSAFVDKEIAKIFEVFFSMQQVGYHWLVEEIANGRVQPLKFREGDEVGKIISDHPPGTPILDSSLYEEADSYDRIYCISGVVYGLCFRETPATREADELLTFQRQQVALRVGEWFSAAGYLDLPNWRLYMERVYAPR